MIPKDPQFDDVCRNLKEALEEMGKFQRNFYPPEIAKKTESLRSLQSSLKETLRLIWEMIVPDELDEALAILDDSSSVVLDILDTILAAIATNAEDTITHVMRAGRRLCRIQEALYPIRDASPFLRQLFLEPGANHLQEMAPSQAPGNVLVGLNHVNTEADDYARGAFSFYVPEHYSEASKWPLVVALHGGSGHGRDFIWTWLREAKSRNFILLAPTSIGRTWSLHNPEADGSRLYAILDFLAEHYRFDTDRILLTGMSDGATFAIICALQEKTPFSAFAPVAGVCPAIGLTGAKGRRIYWIHGALDWMFPVFRAQDGSRGLRQAGADIRFRIIEDLSHSYPREENGRILSWFDSALTLPP